MLTELCRRPPAAPVSQSERTEDALLAIFRKLPSHAKVRLLKEAKRLQDDELRRTVRILSK